MEEALILPFESEDVAAVRDTVRTMARETVPAYQKESYFSTVPRPLFAELAKLGLTGLSIDEENGGTMAPAPTVAAVMEELARVDLGPAIFLSVHLMVAGLLRRFGAAEQRASWLPKLARGEWLGAYALTEPSAGSDAAQLKTTARPHGDGFVLTGDKCYITSAGFADLYLVFARTGSTPGGDSISAFVVLKDTPGLSISPPEKKMGCELSPIASLRFDNAFVPASHLVGTQNGGYRIALAGLAAGRINIAACANGLAITALELALRHLQDRSQFNQKLIAFQGLQFMLADMRMKLDAARLLVQRAAYTLQHRPDAPENRLYPAIAKCFATDSAMSITTDAVQLLGGAGYIQEYGVEKLMRDAKMLQIVEGTNQIQRMLIARQMAASSDRE